ncbi:hypothetical protein KP509_14G005200 [Ceratopteris richardii]|uniref:Rab-GAP TBC domain-containing protein n=1 Tax=Ceratopteris richardii TaxID=49495 RepID=A0A8T2TAA2_CERRI|nr:hypothetical protein KP509_14G005200 [Ceratopteris richardii]
MNLTGFIGLDFFAALYSEMVLHFHAPFCVEHRKCRKQNPFTAKEWAAAFDPNSGCLLSPQKLLDEVRFRGIDIQIRAEVWPFILGFYDLNSTQEDRASEKHHKRESYISLKNRCNALRTKVCELLSETDEGSTTREVSLEDESSSEDVSKCPVSDMGGFSSSGEELNDGLEREVIDADDCVSSETMPSSGTRNTLAAEDVKDDNIVQTHRESVSTAKVRTDMENDCLKVTDEFINCQRIIRLDAVRMNAEWVPYSPSQANVTKDQAFGLARSVGLKDDEHLEPSRQHHAARLVAVLEVYALYDPETLYCQGMSDLLSPFVALFDEDYEAFWCFVEFMNVARFNFRSDEVGIRRQLEKISRIFQAADPHLFSHFKSIGADNCFFVYRMVVVLLRRELTFEQTISLWEVLWAENKALSLYKTCGNYKRRKLPIDDLLLYVIVAAVRQRRKTIIECCRGLDEVLRECNTMAGTLDIWKLLDDAREMVYRVHGQI